MIINNIPFIRKSTKLDIDVITDSDMWQDEEFLKKTASQTFMNYPLVRIGQGFMGFWAVFMPLAITHAVSANAGDFSSILLDSFLATGISVVGIESAWQIINKNSVGFRNYIYKLEAKDRLRKLNRKKKLAVKQNKEQSLENEK